MNDILRDFVNLRSKLQDELAQLKERAAEIMGILSGSEKPAKMSKGRRGRRPKAAGRKPAAKARKAGKSGTGRGRRGNEMSLREAVTQATKGGPLSKEDILAAVQKQGYKFNTKNPRNTLNALLYNKKNKFKNQDGKFGPA